MRPTAALFLLLLTPALRAQSVDHDLIYMKSGGAAFTMDEFRPAKPNGVAVIYLVSGGWSSDHAGINPGVALAFNSQGITVFEVVHGAQPRYKIPEIEQQVARSIRFIRSNAAQFGVEPNKIGIFGASSGGHLSLMSGVIGDHGNPDANDPVDRASSKPNAIVAWMPPTDMINFGSPGRMPFKEQKYLIFQGAFPVKPDATLEEMMPIAKALSPIYGITPSFPPTLLMHGDKDDLVPVEQSQKLDAVFAEKGVEHKLIIIPGAGHGPAGFVERFADVAAWFMTKMK